MGFVKIYYTTIILTSLDNINILNIFLLFKLIDGWIPRDDGMARFGDHCSTIGTILLFFVQLEKSKQIDLL